MTQYDNYDYWLHPSSVKDDIEFELFSPIKAELSGGYIYKSYIVITCKIGDDERTESMPWFITPDEMKQYFPEDKTHELLDFDPMKLQFPMELLHSYVDLGDQESQTMQYLKNALFAISMHRLHEIITNNILCFIENCIDTQPRHKHSHSTGKLIDSEWYIIKKVNTNVISAKAYYTWKSDDIYYCLEKLDKELTEARRDKAPEKTYTVEEAAEILKLHPATLRKYIREEKVRAIKTGQHWKIKQREITRIKRSGIK